MAEPIDPLWSYALSAVGLTVQYLAMKAPRWAWIIGFISQFPWLVYAVVSNQWGVLHLVHALRRRVCLQLCGHAQEAT